MILILLFTFCCAHGAISSQESSCEAIWPQWSVAQRKKLPFLVEAMNELEKRFIPMSKIADMLESDLYKKSPYAFELNCGLGSVYHASIQELFTRSLRKIPKDFLRFTLSLHYRDCMALRIIVDEAELEGLRRVAEREFVFVMTENGGFSEEDFLTLMLCDKYKYLLSVPKDLNTPVVVHDAYEGLGSVILHHDMALHQLEQDAITKGPFAKFFAIALEEFRPLWNEALRLKKDGGCFEHIKDILFWMLHEQGLHYVSECMEGFMDHPLEHLHLKVPVDGFIDASVVCSMAAKISFSKDRCIDTNYELFLREGADIQKRGFAYLRKCEEDPNVQDALAKIKLRVKDLFIKEYEGKLSPLNFVDWPLQKDCMKKLSTRKDLLGIMVYTYNQRKQRAQGLPSSAVLEKECISLMQGEGENKALNMQLVVYAKILYDMHSGLCCDEWSGENLKEKLRSIRVLYNTDAISEKQMFKLYIDEQDYEAEAVCIMSGIPLAFLDPCLDIDSLTRIMCLPSSVSSEMEERIEPFRKRARPLVERALACPEHSHYRNSILRKGYLLFLDFQDLFALPVADFTPKVRWPAKEVRAKTVREILTDANRSHNYILNLCKSKKTLRNIRGEDIDHFLPFVENRPLFLLARDMKKEMKEIRVVRAKAMEKIIQKEMEEMIQKERGVRRERRQSIGEVRRKAIEEVRRKAMEIEPRLHA
ncbi:MAG: hypothetical protein OXC30_01355 [Alphaproteobacteria bacterium]|nr:hypothetical protein [Alphaproteobacteria bacterium]